MIHRDIKPENILLHDGRALVADFGIALAVSHAGGSSRMTETGMSLGTPHYMCPEQAMGEREITARSDIYALGCVLYEMLIAEPPFDGRDGAGDRGAGADRIAPLAPAAAEERAAARRGGGAHRAGEAAGRSLRERQGIRRGAGRSGVRRLARLRDSRDRRRVAGSSPGTRPRQWAVLVAAALLVAAIAGLAAGWSVWHPRPTEFPPTVLRYSDGPAGQPGVDRRPRHADGLCAAMARSSPIPRGPA